MKNLTLLFRVVSKRTREKVDGDFFLEDDGGLFVLEDELPVPKDMEACELVVERCSGIKDKNGVLIYENDILVWPIYGVRTKMTWNAQQARFEWGLLDKMPQDAIVLPNIKPFCFPPGTRRIPIRGKRKDN